MFSRFRHVPREDAVSYFKTLSLMIGIQYLEEREGWERKGAGSGVGSRGFRARCSVLTPQKIFPRRGLETDRKEGLVGKGRSLKCLWFCFVFFSSLTKNLEKVLKNLSSNYHDNLIASFRSCVHSLLTAPLNLSVMPLLIQFHISTASQ